VRLPVLVLHGAWGVERASGDAAFLVWAEAEGSRPSPPAPDGPLPHPFQASGVRIRHALDELAALTEGRVRSAASVAATWTVRLPTRSGRPEPSTNAIAHGIGAGAGRASAAAPPGADTAQLSPHVPLEPAGVGEWPSSKATAIGDDGAATRVRHAGESAGDPQEPAGDTAGEPHVPAINAESELPDPPVALASWLVRGRAVPASDAVWLLALLPTSNDLLPADLSLGADVRYWSVVAKLALELVARERFVPTIEIRGGARARWRPVLADPRDSARYAQLVRAMPPSCRAVGETSQASSAVLSRALAAAVDALVVAGIADGAPEAERASMPRPSSASDAWLMALFAGRSRLQEGAYDLAAFAERVDEWIAPVGGVAEAESLRTCFRLEPPEETRSKSKKTPPADERGWTLQFLLQAADDPSLLVPADRVWDEQSEALDVFSRRLERPQERFLADLGRAAAYFPPLESGLGVLRPTACKLTTAEAYQFLREVGPLLEESGFGVLVPPWWNRQDGRQIGVRMKLGTDGAASNDHVSSGILGRETLVSFDLKIALGDEEIDLSELKRLARLKAPLVQLRGQWVELDPKRTEEAIAFWEKRRRRATISASEALRLALGPTEDAPGLPVVGVDAGGWFAELIGSLDGATAAPDVPITPPGFVGELREYQMRGASWLAFLARHGLGGCLADDMGLGKTVQYIAFVLATRAAEGERKPALLVCPTSVLGNWRRELARFAPDLRVHVHHGSDRSLNGTFAGAIHGSDIVLTTYSLVFRDEATLKEIEWAGVVLDEAQNVKNPQTRQARAVRTFRAGYRFAMTGTPVENRLSELWSILDFANPGYLGSREGFRRAYALPIERFQSAERATQLRRLVRPFVLRRVKTDPRVIQDLPDKLEAKVYCTLTREQASLYQAVVDTMLREIEESDGIERRGRVLATLLRLKQVCNHPASYLSDGSRLAGRSGKLTRLEEMLEEVIDEGEAALVFTQFAEFGGRLARHLQERLGRDVLFLHGGTPVGARDQLVARFQQPDGPPVFLLSLKAGGTGLNLTRATHVFHFDRWWNPAVEDQATDRAFRIGQHRNVHVHKYVCAGTLEDRIDALIAAKQELASQVIGAGETWLTELSTGELRELLALRSEAVVDE